jgi:hypothetical protein
MNRKCTATPIDGYGFVCYDMAPETDFDTYFAKYVTATANVEVVTCADPCAGTSDPCPEENYLNAPDAPRASGVFVFSSGACACFGHLQGGR